MPHPLSVSALFYLSLFQEGATSSDTNSHYFYMKELDTTTTASTASTTSTSTSRTKEPSAAGSSLSPTAASPATTTSTGPTASATQPSTPSAGIATGAKIGIGVGVAAAAIFGVALGWFVSRRRKAREQEISVAERHNLNSGHTDHKNYEAHNSAPVFGIVPPYEVATQGQQGVWPAIFEASGESRVTRPVELDGDPSTLR